MLEGETRRREGSEFHSRKCENSRLGMKETSLFVMNNRFMEVICHAINEHSVALLTEHTKKLLQRDNTIYMPILSQRHRIAAAVYASVLHKLYGIKLSRTN